MNALEIALKMETDAVKFYQEAADKTEHELGKKIFLSIREDELRHIEMIKSVIKEMDIDMSNIDPMKKMITVFEQMKDKMIGGLAATADEKDALKIAMKMEQEGREFYILSAKEATDDKSKALFERLALEEEKHFAIFSNSYSFLDDTGNWFMWDEHSIVEG